MSEGLPMMLTTPRLVLRRSGPVYFERALAIRSNWDVARNLSGAGFPPDASFMAAWFDEHASEWEQGTAYRFAISHQAQMIGIIDLSDVADGQAELGYWLDAAVWGQGFASEAGQAVMAFAFGHVGLQRVIAGHAADNLASGKVLARLGFVDIGEREIFSKPRGEEIVQRRLILEADQWRAGQGAG